MFVLTGLSVCDGSCCPLIKIRILTPFRPPVRFYFSANSDISGTIFTSSMLSAQSKNKILLREYINVNVFIFLTYKSIGRYILLSQFHVQCIHSSIQHSPAEYFLEIPDGRVAFTIVELMRYDEARFFFFTRCGRLFPLHPSKIAIILRSIYH